jgi:hypothetical protein
MRFHPHGWAAGPWETQKQVAELPLNGRYAQQLVFLVPGRTMSPRTTALRTAKGSLHRSAKTQNGLALVRPREVRYKPERSAAARVVCGTPREAGLRLTPKQAIASLSDLRISATRVLPLRAPQKSLSIACAGFPNFSGSSSLFRRRLLGTRIRIVPCSKHTYRTESRRLMPVPKASPGRRCAHICIQPIEHFLGCVSISG